LINADEHWRTDAISCPTINTFLDFAQAGFNTSLLLELDFAPAS